MEIFKAVRVGKTSAVQEYLAATPRHKVPIDLLSVAIDACQPYLLRLLAAHKQPLALKSTDQFSTWGRALANNDAQYLALLVEYGAYESVVCLPDYGGTEFLYASPEALRYLLDNQLTGGLEQAFCLLVRRRKNRRLLAVFPDSYFFGLTPVEQVNLLSALMTWAPERIETLFLQNDYAELLRFFFKSACDPYRGVGDLWKFLPILFGTSISGPEQQWNFEDEKFLSGIRAELSDIAGALC